jgi:DNA-binding response OmpR family regulator
MPDKKKILLVEDEEDLRKSLNDRLFHQYEVYEAVDGEQGVAMCIDHHPDVILLDLLLPKLDGFKVLERIRKYPDTAIAHTPVIVLSNLWTQKDILQVQGLKIDGYFVKAHTKMEDVISRIHQVFASIK